MFSKAKMGMLMGTMAVALSLGSVGGAMAADTGQSAPFDKSAVVKFKAGKMGHHGGVGFKENTELLSLLKLDAGKLQEELKTGKTLAAIAEAQGVETDDVVSLLVEQQEAKLKKAVEAGKLTQEQADKLSENMSERVKEQVENPKLHKGFKGGFLGGFDKNEELLSLLKLDAEQLKEAQKSGKSLATIAGEQGVEVDEVVALLTEQQEAKLKEAVTAGKLTQEQADKRGEQLEAMVQKMVDGSFEKVVFPRHDKEAKEQEKTM